MSQDIHSFIERYQLLYERDPKSKVFAPLAEAYRRMGLIDEAIDLAERGVKEHPNFASGRVALGKCYVQKAKYAEGAEQLKVASELSPENLLAHQLLAECYSRLDRPVDAMNAYKLVLFLNPNDARVGKIVRDLETQIYAGPTSAIDDEKGVDFAEEEYSMTPLQTVQAPLNEDVSNSPFELKTRHETGAGSDTAALKKGFDLERDLALFDSRHARGDWTSARELLDNLLKKEPQHPEVLKRKNFMDEITNPGLSAENWMAPLEPEELNPKIKRLEKLLTQIDERKRKA